MQLTFHGAARTVTGSQHLVEVNGVKILLDCGLFQGKRKDAYARNQKLPFDASQIDYVVLSHAHIDHSGNLPNLVKSGFGGDIICTFATRNLCSVMLRDSGRIQEYDVAWLNKKRARKGEPPVDPIYTENDAIQAMKHFLAISYERAYKLTPDIQVTFYDAGHMLGSAMVALDINDHATGKQHRLVFSGDLGRYDIPILRDPTTLDAADTLIMESTYGNRSHAPVEDSTADLKRIVKETFARGGSIVVPAFAVGRTQQLVYTLHQLQHSGDLPPLNVYVDSPLAINATGVFRQHAEDFDAETRAFMDNDEHRHTDPFGFDGLRYTPTTAESKELNDLKEPAIIISASGMAEAGRILHHLRNRISDPRNTVLIVGWQAPHTLGRRIVEKQPKVRIFGEEYDLKAQVAVLNGFSGHADHDGLLDWAKAFTTRQPKRTFLVHGEPDAADALAAALKKEVGLKQVDVPDLHQSFEV